MYVTRKGVGPNAVTGAATITTRKRPHRTRPRVWNRAVRNAAITAL